MINFNLNIQYIFCLAILLLKGSVSYGFNGKYPIQNFSPAEYEAGNQNIDFAQNRDMDLFVANNLGVLSYNGNEWQKHAFRSGKKKRSLAFDASSNRLYVGSQGEFGYFQNNWNYVSLNDQIPLSYKDFDEVWDVYLADSKVYFCTFTGIYVYDGQTISVIKHENGLNRSFFANGKILAQSQQGDLLEVDDHQFIFKYKQRLSGEVLAGVIPQADGYLLFYNSGLIERTVPFGTNEIYEDLIQVLKGSYVNHVLQLSDTRLVISTQTSGLILFDPQQNTIEKITTQHGLQTNACLRTFQDYAGNLWVGMQNGIALIHINSPLRFINQEINIQGSGYEAFETNEGTYFTTSNGIYFLATNSKESVFLQGTEGPAYGMKVIAGSLYAGHHTGLFKLESGIAQKLASTDGLWQIKQIKSNPEYAIAGTYSGLFLFRLNENRILEAVQEIEGFNESSRFFEEDQLGRILVGQYYKGLYQLVLENDFTKVTAKKVTNDDDLPIDEQIILTSIDNELYIATNEGLYNIDQTRDMIVKEGFFSEVIGEQPVYLIKEDKQRNVHIVAENMVGFFKRISAQNYVFVPSSLFQLRYYFNNDLLNVSVNVDNGILFSSNQGFIHYNPDLEDRIVNEYALLVNSVTSVSQDSIFFLRNPFDIQPVMTEDLVLPQKAHVIQFHVESFQFNEVRNKQFRYFLRGFDEDYGEWTTASTKEYTNLMGGEYAFFVQTRNYLGEIVTSQPFFLHIKPPFYLSIYAKVLYWTIGVLILFLAYRFQKYRYKQKAKEAEETKQQELVSKQQELDSIEQQKEEELQQLKEDKITSELEHIKNLLAASTMNLVVKNEFIETIKEEIKVLTRKGKNGESREALDQLVKRIDKTLRLQEDWEQFEFHFDQVHGDFLSRLRDEFRDLTPNEQKLCTLLRLNLNTKEIANLMSISLRGVEVARYRLRKKLCLHQGENLSRFILNY